MERTAHKAHRMQDVANLQARLDELLRIAKSNERKQENFQQYELALLNATNLLELFSIILDEHKTRFQLSEVTLLLYDPEYEFQRLLNNQTNKPDSFNRILFTDSQQLLSQYFGLQRKPKLGAFLPHLHQHLFPNQQIGSIALLPLIRQQNLIGSLNLGSRNPTRFQTGIGTQFLRHLAAVVSACIENARLQEHVKLVGLKDALTGINNRRFFDQRLDEEVNRALRKNSPLSCLFLDLDYFKKINDSFGHQVGDSVLRKVAQTFETHLRSSDVLARYGGEEFVILLADTADGQAYEIAEKLRQLVSQESFLTNNGDRIQVTVSIGLATLSPYSGIKTKQQLIHAADQAVYIAKSAGRNQVKRTQ